MGNQATVTRGLASVGHRLAASWHVITPPWTNYGLDSIAWIAITRGVLYGFGAQPTDLVPRGLDLVPEGFLYGYGVLWFVTGVLSVFAARGQSGKRQLWSQRVLGALCIVWATFFFAGVIYPAELPPDLLPQSARTVSLISCAFYLWLARIVLHAESEATILHRLLEKEVDAK